MNESIVITGATGYLGSYLIPVLIKNNYKIYGIDVNECNIKSTHTENYVLINSDFNGAKQKLAQLIKNNEKISTVIHCAGQSDANESNNNPVEAYKNNVNLTLEVLEYCRENEIHNFYFPSTGLVYGEYRHQKLLNEESEIRPSNFYAWTKYIAEQTIKSYCMNFKLNATIMRFNNIIGYHLKKGTILSDIYEQINDNKKNIIVKDGNPIRDFIHVEDAVSAFISLMKINKYSNFEIYNVSNGNGLSILELARMICAYKNLPPSMIFSQKSKNKNPLQLVLDNNKLKITGWLPKYSIEDCIKQLY